MASQRTTLITLAALALAVLLAGCSLASEPVPAGPVEVGPLPGALPASSDFTPVIANGAAIFAARCASCHGSDGAGGGEFAATLQEQGSELPDLSDPALARSRSPKDWFTTITNGTVSSGGLMPPWRNALSEQERWDVTYYLYSLSQPEDGLAQGQAIVEEVLAPAGCLGADAGLEDFAAMIERSQGALITSLIQGEGCPDGASLTDAEAAAAAYYLLAGVADTSAAPAAAAPPEAQATPGAEPAEPPAEEPAETDLSTAGVVTGTLINRSTLQPLEGVEVRLRGLMLDEAGQVQEFLSERAVTDAQGAYRFEGLPVDMTNAAYVVDTTFNGTPFGNGTVIDPLITAMTIPLDVFETQNDPATIFVDTLHLIIEEMPGGLLVTQIYQFSNSGNGIYVTPISTGSEFPPTVGLTVPEGAVGLEFDGGTLGQRFIEAGGVYYDTQQITPGQGTAQVAMRYVLPTANRYEISLPMLYNTGPITVLVGGEGRVRSDLLSEGGLQSFGQDVTFMSYTGTGLNAGDTLDFTVRYGATFVNDVLPPLLVGLGVVLLGVVVFLFIRERRAAQAAAEEDEELEALTGTAADLAARIAALDAEFEAGQINRVEYETRRAELKAALAEEIDE